MWKTFDNDRENIENKYHKTNEPFNAFDRMHHHGYDYDPTTGLDDEEIKKGRYNAYGLQKIPVSPMQHGKILTGIC